MDPPKIPSRGPAHKPSAPRPPAERTRMSNPCTEPRRRGHGAESDAVEEPDGAERGVSCPSAGASLWRSVAAMT
jgi:hypothetical protein